MQGSSRPATWRRRGDERDARDGRKVRGRMLLVSSGTPRRDRGRTAAIHDASRPQRTTWHPPGPPRRRGDLAQEPCPIAFQNGGNPVKTSSRTRRFDRRDLRIAIPLPGQTAFTGIQSSRRTPTQPTRFGIRPPPHGDDQGLPGLHPHACPGPPRRRRSAYRRRAAAGGHPRSAGGSRRRPSRRRGPARRDSACREPAADPAAPDPPAAHRHGDRAGSAAADRPHPRGLAAGAR